MKIIVILRVAADSLSPVRIEQGRVAPDSLRPVLNPFDEAALAKAVDLRAKDTDREVVALLTAPMGHDTLLQRAFALGAQRVIHLCSTPTVQEPIEQARQLVPVLRQEQPDLILIGCEVLGDDCGDTGAMLSALLDCSLATDAVDLSLSTHEVLVTRETAGDSEDIALRLPALVTAELALANPRYVTLMELAAARKKPVERLESAECPTPALASLSLNPVAPRQRGILLNSVAELATRIRAEIGTLP
jgi:electron transfer flavoprotein beta subunit